MIYLDNAATTQISSSVAVKMYACMKLAYGNPDSPHKAGAEARRHVSEARQSVATMLDCGPENIVFTSGGTEANNLALADAAAYMKAHGLDHIITSAAEHKSVLAAIEELQRRYGFDVTYLRPGRNGAVSPPQVKQAIRKGTGLVSIMYVNNETGAITNSPLIGEICEKHGILYHVDCVQAAGFYNIGCDILGADYITVSAHKLHGPKGAGCLYRRGPMNASILFGGSQESGMRPGTLNVPAIVGFGVAADALQIPFYRENVVNRIEEYAGILSDGLRKIKDCHANFDLDKCCPKVLSFRFGAIDSQTLVYALNERGVCVSEGAACNSYASEPSYVLLASGLTEQEASSTIRISPSDMNTPDEIRQAIQIIEQTVTFLRSR